MIMLRKNNHKVGEVLMSQLQIQQVLKDAELYEDEEEVSSDEIMFNDQSNDDLEVIAEESLEIEKHWIYQDFCKML
ncbi:2138_t:CDS:2 [Funneliformis mosseae]|uniref:2138_t:CDS:1 n=1 Tax=Funneliformis mosseae TaxID=27381 RepID=A0A9N9B8T9_FUNMO|nr:2138_t:CDS:2 [Funneliformis mosseae]